MHVGGRSETATRTNQPGLVESNGGEWLSETGAQVLLRWAQTGREGGRRKKKKEVSFFSDTIKMEKNTSHVSIVVGSNRSSAFY